MGCGIDNLTMGLVRYCPDELMDFVEKNNSKVDKAHNEYLHIAATAGIPALIVYLIFVAIIVLPKIKQMLTNKLYFIITIVLVSYLVQAFFNISTIGVAPLFWMIMGLADNKVFIEKLEKII